MVDRPGTGGQDVGLDADAANASTGLSCLRLIGRLHGIAFDRITAAAPHDGEPDLHALAALGERAGFRCRVLSLDGRHLGELKRALPAIAVLRDGRRVVLARIEDRGGAPQVVVQDPSDAGGAAQVWLRAAFELAWRGDLLLIKKAENATHGERPFGWRAVAEIARGQGPLLRDLVLATAALGALGLAPILFAQALLGDVSIAQTSDTSIFLGCALVLAMLFEAAFGIVRQGLVTRLASRVSLRIETLVFDRVLRLPVTVFETTPVGVLAHRIGAAAAVPALLAGPLARAMLDGCVVVVFLAGMLTISLALTGLVLALGAFAVVVVALLNTRLRRSGVAVEAAEEDGAALLTETLVGFAALKSLALEARQRRRWDVLIARATRLRLREGDAANVLGTVSHLLERVIVFGPTVGGVALAVTGFRPISGAALFGGLLLSWHMAASLRDIVDLARGWNAGQGAVATLAALVDAAPEVARDRTGVRAALNGDIVFSGVQFTYPEAPSPALQSVSFTVPAGTVLGIVGRSGAGKSTLARLLQRFHADYQGLIKIDGIDVREIDLDHLRARIGVVTQDAALFPGSIRDTLLAMRPQASEEDLALALRLVGAEALVDRLPRGLDTVLDERAAPLSDGERQQIAIARALLADPAILVLDEATAALDPESEALLFGNLRRLGAGRTLVVISQRLAALAQADAILVLDRGEVQDIGPHAELVERSDLYNGLWRRQTARLPRPDPEVPPRLRGDRVA